MKYHRMEISVQDQEISRNKNIKKLQKKLEIMEIITYNNKAV